MPDVVIPSDSEAVEQFANVLFRELQRGRPDFKIAAGSDGAVTWQHGTDGTFPAPTHNDGSLTTVRVGTGFRCTVNVPGRKIVGRQIVSPDGLHPVTAAEHVAREVAKLIR